jgi:hypothetical protein
MATTSFERKSALAYPSSAVPQHQILPRTAVVEAIAAGGVDNVDNSGTVTNPESHIDGPGRNIIVFNDTDPGFIRFRLKRDDGDTPSADPVGAPFGRRTLKDQNGNTTGYSPWERLVDSTGDNTHTFTTASSDASDGTWQYTAWSPLYDRNGCDQIVLGLTTAYAVGAGNAALAIIEALAA